eukprot:TRINITY_DN6314_c0_g1_i2.p1 TRINITY_DN6314_c0_g1~~TRINITY_DN6314_c0_g1_i2.p1  ORF type:complete len:203 (-),score=26.73 TRINITY_DN6314_c0_g1_i2:825-1433(-)
MKIDIWLEQVAQEQISQKEIRVGQELILKKQQTEREEATESCFSCFLTAEKRIGNIPQSIVLPDSIEDGGVSCTVRTIKRGSEEGSIKGIMVRLDDTRPPRVNETNNERIEEKCIQREDEKDLEKQQQSSQFLSRAQFELLVASSELRQMLKDERLQEMIKYVDSSEDREIGMERLEEMLVDQEFQKFADIILDTVNPIAKK